MSISLTRRVLIDSAHYYIPIQHSTISKRVLPSVHQLDGAALVCEVLHKGFIVGMFDLVAPSLLLILHELTPLVRN